MSNFDKIIEDFHSQTVVIRGKGKHLERQAKRDGKTESIAKNRMSAQNIKMAKIDNETETTKVVKIDKKLSKQILEGRKAKSWTQKELAGKLNMKPVDIQKYENGSAIPNPQQVSKIKRLLGITKHSGAKN